MKNKDKVYESYEKIADWFDENRSRDLFEKSYLDKAMAHLTSGAKILDLGCGMGEPIAGYLIEKGFDLTSVDGSQKLINLAKARFPNSLFMVEDMRRIELKRKYACIIAWHSFFHLPQDDQRAMFEVFEDHMNHGGILLFTSGPDAGEVWSDNGGEDLYHASLSSAEYESLLKKHHFEVMVHNIDDEQCGGATVWMARYSKNEETQS